jgi:radical SAM-linked protein
LYRISYSRRGDVRFLGHLELIQVFFRALSRAKAELKFSQGFNPSPKVAKGLLQSGPAGGYRESGRIS